MRLEWKSSENGGPFGPGFQIIELRDLVPDGGTMLCYLNLKRTSEEPSSGQVSVQIETPGTPIVENPQGFVLDFGSNRQSLLVQTLFEKLPKDEGHAESELRLRIIADDGITDTFSLDFSVV